MTSAQRTLALVVMTLLGSPLAGSQFANFYFAEDAGRPGHTGLFPISGPPRPGPQSAQAILKGPLSQVAFHLRDSKGTDLGLAPLVADDLNQPFVTFAGVIDVPTSPFRLEASGELANGTPFTVLYGETFTPTPVGVRFLQELPSLSAGATATVRLRVENRSSETEFTVDLEVIPPDYLKQGLPQQVSIASGADAELEASVSAPLLGPPIEEISLSIGVEALLNKAIRGTGNRSIYIHRNMLLFADGFELGTVERWQP